MSGTQHIGGSAPKPPGFIAFFPPEWMFFFIQGAGSPCPRLSGC
jgi:hypothetical protein